MNAVEWIFGLLRFSQAGRERRVEARCPHICMVTKWALSPEGVRPTETRCSQCGEILSINAQVSQADNKP